MVDFANFIFLSHFCTCRLSWIHFYLSPFSRSTLPLQGAIFVSLSLVFLSWKWTYKRSGPFLANKITKSMLDMHQATKYCPIWHKLFYLYWIKYFVFYKIIIINVNILFYFCYLTFFSYVQKMSLFCICSTRFAQHFWSI